MNDLGFDWNIISWSRQSSNWADMKIIHRDIMGNILFCKKVFPKNGQSTEDISIFNKRKKDKKM